LFADLKADLEALWQKSDLNVDDTKPKGLPPPRVGACAEFNGAAYYALQHNRSADNNSPLLITFEADIADVIIDGRDFLYTSFQLGNPDKARSILGRLFGAPILRYVDRAWATERGSQQRIALCDLAVQDEAVIGAHARNTAVIGGRYRTRFCNAFLVKLPIGPDRIIDVVELGPTVMPNPDVTLDDVR
jgi:hypothetical protein